MVTEISLVVMFMDLVHCVYFDNEDESRRKREKRENRESERDGKSKERESKNRWRWYRVIESPCPSHSGMILITHTKPFPLNDGHHSACRFFALNDPFELFSALEYTTS